MFRLQIAATGTEIPVNVVTNEDLAASYNEWAAGESARLGNVPVPLSDPEFIHKASGIRERRVLEKDGILDPARMAPRLTARHEDSLSVMAEFGAAAARKALGRAGIAAADVDMVICAASHHQRPYPAIAIEIQRELGCSGAAFDMGLGCSSAAAGIHVAACLVRSGAHERVMVVSPEILTGHLDFRDRQTHFIFGDAATAVIVERLEGNPRPGAYEITDTRMWTSFSNNIRTDFGFLGRAEQENPGLLPMSGLLIRQRGNRVFKEVTSAGHRFIGGFLAENGLQVQSVSRFWLHQANARMNAMMLRLCLGHDPGPDLMPLVLDRLGNTASAGAVIAFERYSDDLPPGAVGLLCAFGAGYSIGGALLRRLEGPRESME